VAAIAGAGSGIRGNAAEDRQSRIFNKHPETEVNSMAKYNNILLVYPKVPDNTYWSYKYALKFIRKKSSMPPLGLLTIAALFPEHYNLKLVDMNTTPLTDADIEWADAVFLSVMIVQKASMEAVVARCREFGKTIVAGGPYVNNNHETIIGVDHLLTGEVDGTFTDFLDDLQQGTAQPAYPMPKHPDIATLPVPRFDLLDMDAYGSMAVQYSRGCPFHCEFCDIWTVYGNRPRLKTAESLIGEIDTLYHLGWKGAVFVVDDNFIGNRHRVKTELLPALTAWQSEHGRPFHFYTEASINLADDEVLLNRMREAGFNEVFIGIETPSREGLAETGKSQNLKSDMPEAVRTIQKYGIEVLAGFILGFDSDTPDIFDRQIDFIEKTAIPKAMVGLLNALPGTRLHQRLKNEGRLLEASIGNNTHSMGTNFRTIMAAKNLREGYRKILSHLYGYRLKHYFNRCNQLLDRIEYRDYYQRKIHFSDLRILFKSLFRQPFTPYGFHYLKFISRNMIKNRDVFAEVISLSVCGHHFHTITRETMKKEKVASLLDAKYNQFCDLVNQYSESLRNNSCSRESIQYTGKLWKTRIRLLKQMKTQIDKLKGEFRVDLSRKYIDISGKMRDQLARFEADTATMVMSAERQVQG
jgi:radical SAM superfamily enzyme YgiQ (UPF0313 family)